MNGDDKLMEQALAQFQRNDLSGAETQCLSLLERSPRLGAAWSLSGVIAAATARLPLAIERFQKAVECEPNNSAFLTNLGNALRDAGRTAEALDCCQRAVNAAPLSPDALNNLGLVLIDLKRNNEAENVFIRALANAPRHFFAWNNLGIVQRAQGKNNEALNSFLQSLAINPAYAEARANFGLLLLETRSAEEALHHLRQAAAALPGHAPLIRAVARTCSILGIPDEAERYLRHLIATQPPSAELWHDLGVALREQGKLDDAEEAYGRAIALERKSARSWANLATVYQAKGRHDEACRHYSTALSIQPDHANALTGLGVSQLHCGKREEALASFEQALALNPLDYSTQAYRIAALQDLGRNAEADYLLDLDRDIAEGFMKPPAPYRDFPSFASELAAEIQRHPTLLREPAGKATKDGLQTRNLLDTPSTLMVTLESALRSEIDDFLGHVVPDPNHPHWCRIPTRYSLYVWATVLHDAGHQRPHLHGSSWLSGVLYVSVPDAITDASDSHAGWIEFGRRIYSLPEQQPAKIRLIKPEPGKLLLFPGHLFHGTLPAPAGTRISIAFDLLPLEFAPGNNR